MVEKQRLPQDITNLLALCIRDLIWFKTSILAFFAECGVPESILLQARREKDAPTLRMVPAVLEQLYEKGDEGFTIARVMLTKIYHWRDIHSVPLDRKDQAVASLKALQQAYKLYEAQRQYQRENEAQRERDQRLNVAPLDHAKLQGFRERFDGIYFLDAKERGDNYEALLNEVFAYYFPDAFHAFNRTGEQVDGQFYFDSHWYVVEIRWRNAKASAADVSVLRDRAGKGFAGDVRAVFISYNGFSDDCLESLEASGERVILLTGYDFRSVLECDIALDVLVHRIQALLIRNKVTYISAKEVIEM